MDKIPLTLQYRLSFDLARRPLLCDESDEDKVYSLLICQQRLIPPGSLKKARRGPVTSGLWIETRPLASSKSQRPMLR